MATSEFGRAFLGLLNGLREQHGVPPLAGDARLEAAAQWKAEDMVERDYFAHDTPGLGPNEALCAKFGYDPPGEHAIGENILWGGTGDDARVTAEEAFLIWRESPDHFANMVHPGYRAVGIGGPFGEQGARQFWGMCVTEFGSVVMEPAGGAVPSPRKPRRKRPRPGGHLPHERPPRKRRRRKEGQGDDDEPPRREAGAAPSGPITTAAPPGGGSFGITWDELNRWDDLVLAAATEVVDRFAPPEMAPALLATILKAMIAIESRGRMHDANGKVIERDDGFGDGVSVGLMQVKPRLWQGLVPDADPYTPQGNIRLGAAIMAQAIRHHGSWRSALTNVYFPDTDPNRTTQAMYVAAVRGLLDEMGAVGASGGQGAPDGAEFVPFPAPRAFHVRSDTHATGRPGPHRAAAPVREFGPGEAVVCDGFFRGEVVEGEGRWLRTGEPPGLAVHAGAFVEAV